MSRRTANRFVISPFQKQVQLDPQFADNTWHTLKNAIREINHRRTSDLSYEQLYRYSYNMVLHKHGDYLYSGLTKLLSEHLREVAAQIRAAHTENFLSEVRTQWAWFELSLGHVRDVLMYMDRTYVKSKKKKSVNDLGVSLFRDIVIRDKQILPRLVESLLGQIDAERNGEVIDAQMIRAITRMLAELGSDDDGLSVYVKVFENEFLNRTKLFYAREAQLYLADANCSEYLRKANARIREEKCRVESYMEAQTEVKVCRVTEAELISKYMKVLVDMKGSGLIYMLRNDKFDDLQLMHALFRNVKDGDETIRSNLKKEVLDRGNAVVSDQQHSNDPVALINAVLALKDKYDCILRRSFSVPTYAVGEPIDSANFSVGPGQQGGTSNTSHISNLLQGQTSLYSTGVSTPNSPASNVAPDLALGSGTLGSSSIGASCGAGGAPKQIVDRRYTNALNEAFERFVNTFSNAAEYLSLYVDKLLRKDARAGNDEEVENKLDSVMTLFRYLHEKDVFERYYKIHLQRRLLDSRSTSFDAERSFISKIKNECGYLYTSKMEVMFNDMKISAETSSQFREFAQRRSLDMKGIDFSGSVLTTMSWPITSTAPCNLPTEATHVLKHFENFYLNAHEGRRLTWQTALGTAEICGRFGGGTRVVDLVVQSHAMCVLMLFNSTDKMTYKELKVATKIPETELIRNLQSLSLAKYRVLTKEPATKEVNENDVFSFNDKFTCRNRRIKLQMVAPAKEQGAVQSQMRARIDDDRKPLIEAAIVRTMKHRKILEHNKLIIEVTNQLSSRFQPNPQDIKRRIESLVEREFLERKADQRQVYQYMA